MKNFIEILNESLTNISPLILRRKLLCGGIILDAFYIAFEKYSDIILATESSNNISDDDFEYLNYICNSLGIDSIKFDDMKYTRSDVKNPSGNIYDLAVLFGIEKSQENAFQSKEDFFSTNLADENIVKVLTQRASELTIKKIKIENDTAINKSFSRFIEGFQSAFEVNIEDYKVHYKFYDNLLSFTDFADVEIDNVDKIVDKISKEIVNTYKSDKLKDILADDNRSGKYFKVYKNLFSDTVKSASKKTANHIENVIANTITSELPKIILNIITDSKDEITKTLADKVYDKLKDEYNNIIEASTKENTSLHFYKFFDSPKDIKKRMNGNYLKNHIKNIFLCLSKVSCDVKAKNIKSLKYIYLLYKTNKIFKPLDNFIQGNDMKGFPIFSYIAYIYATFNRTARFKKLPADFHCKIVNQDNESNNVILQSLTKDAVKIISNEILKFFIETEFKLQQNDIWEELLKVSYVEELLQKNPFGHCISSLLSKYENNWKCNNVTYFEELVQNIFCDKIKFDEISLLEAEKNPVIFEQKKNKLYATLFNKAIINKSTFNDNINEKNIFISFDFVEENIETKDDTLICPLMIYKLTAQNIEKYLKRIRDKLDKIDESDYKFLNLLLLPMEDLEILKMNAQLQYLKKQSVFEWRKFFEIACKSKYKSDVFENISFGQCSTKAKEECHRKFMKHLRKHKLNELKEEIENDI